jgi:hypothetical protein
MAAEHTHLTRWTKDSSEQNPRSPYLGIDVTLTFVPFRKLPPWLKRRWLLTGVRDTVQGWWLRAADTAWRTVRRRRP